MKTRNIVVLLSCLTVATALHAQLLVDCSGSNPNAYPSINAALPNASPGSSIIVTGTCNESVWLQGINGLNLGAWWGQTATISGGISISNSTLIYLYGLNVTNPSGNGVSVSNSRSVVLDNCTSNGNAGAGLTASNMSDVSVNATGAFDGASSPMENSTSWTWARVLCMLEINVSEAASYWRSLSRTRSGRRTENG